MSDEIRAQLLETLTQRLGEMDVSSLQQLEALTQQSPARVTGGALTRRQFVAGAALGGGAGLLLAAGSGFAAWQFGQTAGSVGGHLEALAAEAEVTKLKGLVTLYEALEGVGLDAIAALGIGTVGGLLHGLEGGVRLLEKGTQEVESALKGFTALFPIIREGITWAEGLVSSLSDKLVQLQAAIGSAVTGAKPLTDAMGDFFNFVLGLLPADVQKSVRDTLARIQAVITSIPDAVEGLNNRLLAPLRQNWFSDESASNLETTLVAPITTGLLDPLQKHLADLAGLLDQWETGLAKPVQAALDQRQTIREQITHYRQEHGLSEGGAA
jgi:hypothetical protein